MAAVSFPSKINPLLTHYPLANNKYKAYIKGMKLLGAILYHIFVVLGWSFLISKVVSRLLGLKEKAGDNIGLALAYFLSIVLAVSVCWYIYNRKAPTPEASHPETIELQPRIDDLRRTLQKPAVILRSTPAPGKPEGHVSCLGRVTWQLPGETCPVDEEGKPLEPLATLFVPKLPGVPAELSNVALITIFATEEGWAEAPETKPQLGCVIRTYPTLDGLVPCDYVSGIWKTCILTPEAVKHDMPRWPDCGGTDEEWDIIRALEKKHKIDYHENICDTVYESIHKADFPQSFSADDTVHAVYETHKFGGYPTYIQDNEVPENHTYVMQVGYDPDAGFEFADCGCYYFYYNAEKNSWRVLFDSY